MNPDAKDIAIIDADYDFVGWLHDRFGFDVEAHYVGTDVSISLKSRDAARVHFDMMVTHADLDDLMARRKNNGA